MYCNNLGGYQDNNVNNSSHKKMKITGIILLINGIVSLITGIAGWFIKFGTTSRTVRLAVLIASRESALLKKNYYGAMMYDEMIKSTENYEVLFVALMVVGGLLIIGGVIFTVISKKKNSI